MSTVFVHIVICLCISVLSWGEPTLWPNDHGRSAHTTQQGHEDVDDGWMILIETEQSVLISPAEQTCCIFPPLQIVLSKHH